MNKELLNCERVWLNVTPATLRPDLADYGLLEPHALGVHEGKIHALVPMQDLKGPYPAHWQDMKGKLVTPGLIDCHTHIVFGGQRAAEFARRTAGTSYADIAREGYETGKSLHDIVVKERKLLTQEKWDEVFSFENLVSPKFEQ